MSLIDDKLAAKTPRRIHLLSSGGDPRIEEDRAAETITPGMLLATNSSGNVRKHNVAGGPHERKFALEPSLGGGDGNNLRGGTIDTDYASGELVRNVHAEPGDVIYAWLKNGEHATADEFLTSNGDGTLKVTSGTNVTVGKALEEVDLTDTAVENGRIRVRIV